MAHNQEYAHRNGEVEPPQVEGHYFFKGRRKVHPRRVCRRVFIQVWELNGELVHRFLGYSGTVDSLVGQWWGPVTLPWEED